MNKRQSLLIKAGEVAGFIDEVIELRNKNNLYDGSHHDQLASFDKIKILHNQDAQSPLRYKN